jgi:hypothetical protein
MKFVPPYMGNKQKYVSAGANFKGKKVFNSDWSSTVSSNYEQEMMELV